MTLHILYAGRADQFQPYQSAVESGLASHGIAAQVRQDISPDQVDYIIYAPNSAVQDFTPFTRCKAVLSLWAGVERVVGNPTLTQPLVRMVDSGLSQGMVNWVTGHALRYLLQFDRMTHNPDRVWDDTPPPLARDWQVTILGLGELGTACAQALRHQGFRVAGWSRRPKTVDGVQSYAGPDGLIPALAAANIAVLLLPDTPQTENTLNAQTLAALPQGAYVLNPGRGPQIDDAALLAALDSGHIAGATLDVFRTEPLPADDPYWDHASVTVTPHIASATRTQTAADSLVDNICRAERGQPLLNVVDRAAGY